MTKKYIDDISLYIDIINHKINNLKLIYNEYILIERIIKCLDELPNINDIANIHIKKLGQIFEMYRKIIVISNDLCNVYHHTCNDISHGDIYNTINPINLITRNTDKYDEELILYIKILLLQYTHVKLDKQQKLNSIIMEYGYKLNILSNIEQLYIDRINIYNRCSEC
jgi:hypothetical protein